jgi:dethiobiotin synthetase
VSKTATFFITGTDTDVGKTRIACGLLHAAAGSGLQTAAVKPIAAGCDEQGHNEDALLLQQAMTMELDYQQVNPVALTPAIAPHIAAAEAGRQLNAGRLAGYCRGVMMSEADFVVIEGAGGWRVPLNHRETFANIAIELQIPVILVVAMRLGCINHALLTVEAICQDGLRLAGWVANTTAETMPHYAENLATLRNRIAAPLLGEVPRLETPDHRAVSPFLDLSQIM